MRFEFAWTGCGIAVAPVVLLSGVLLSAPGCGSGAASGTGVMLSDAAPAAPGQMTSASYHKSQKNAPASQSGSAAQARARRGQR